MSYEFTNKVGVTIGGIDTPVDEGSNSQLASQIASTLVFFGGSGVG